LSKIHAIPQLLLLSWWISLLHLQKTPSTITSEKGLASSRQFFRLGKKKASPESWRGRKLLLSWVSSSSTVLSELAPRRDYCPGRLPRYHRAGPSTSLDKSVDFILFNCRRTITQSGLSCQGIERQDRAFDIDCIIFGFHSSSYHSIDFLVDSLKFGW
jgi:hypothetical protein